MQMTTETLDLSWPEKDVALVAMTRGSEMNTLTHALLGDFGEALDRVSGQSPRALIVTGAGRAFCCGAHLDYFTDDRLSEDAAFELRDAYLERIARLFDRLEDLAFPVIAAINGFALGGGFEMALSCDIRIMSRQARIGLPEVQLGALAGAGGVQKLSRHVGRSKAMEWILLGSHVEADEAERRGLLHSVTDPGEEVPAALALVARLRDLSPRAIAQSKRAILACEDMDPRNARRFGLESLSMLIGSRDWQTGIAAFHAKRPPKFD